MPSKADNARAAFDVVSDENGKQNGYKCKRCGKTLAWSKSATHLINHLDTKHAAETQDPAQPVLSLKRLREKDAIDATIRCWVCNGWSWNCFEHPAFSAMIKSLGGEMPSLTRKSMSDKALDLEREERSLFLASMDGENVSLAIDLGTIESRHFATVTIQRRGTAFFWNCYEMPDENSNWSDLAKSYLCDATQVLNDHGAFVVGVVSDNASSMTKGVDAWSELTGGLPLRCFAHSVQLLVKEVEDHSAFNDSREAVTRLIEKKIVERPCVTRWNSWYRALEAADKKKLELQAGEVPLLTPDEAAAISKDLAILKPFRLWTDVAQADWSTVFDMLRMWDLVAQSMESAPRQGWGKKAREVMAERTIKNFAGPAIVLALAVSPSINWNEICATERYVVTHALSVAGAKLVAAKIKKDVAIVAASLIAEFEAYSNRRHQEADPSQFFGVDKNERDFGTLKQLYTLLNALPSSEASVERAFSAHKLIVDERRTRLSTEVASACLFLRCSYAAARSNPKRPQDAGAHIGATTRCAKLFLSCMVEEQQLNDITLKEGLLIVVQQLGATGGNEEWVLFTVKKKIAGTKATHVAVQHSNEKTSQVDLSKATWKFVS